MTQGLWVRNLPQKTRLVRTATGRHIIKSTSLEKVIVLFLGSTKLKIEHATQFFEYKCYRKLQRANFKDRKTNFRVKAEIERKAQTEPITGICQLAQTRKMRSRDETPGTVSFNEYNPPWNCPRITRKGRQRRTWTDDLKKWPGQSHA